MKNKTFIVEYEVKGTIKTMEINAGGLDTAKGVAERKATAKKGKVVSIKQKVDRSNME